MERDADGMPNQDEVLRRLSILWLKLEAEGSYVGANTVALAQELIRWQEARLFMARQGMSVPAADAKNG